MSTEGYSKHLIRMARRRAGLTQQALADRAATTQSAISAYESGRRSPSVHTLVRILAAAGLELRMRAVEPDSHDASRRKAEAMLPADQLERFKEAERRRLAGNDSRRIRTSLG